MRYLYTALFYLLLPFISLRLLWRSRRQKTYRNHLGERFGFYSAAFPKSLWIHAVSVGESIAAFPLIRELQKQYPDFPIVVTNMTPTGRAHVKTVLGDTVTTVYLPYDIPYFIKRFIKAMHPIAGIFIETELWPNIINVCHNKRIPICLLNARLSKKSFKGYMRIQTLAQQMLHKIYHIAAVSADDAKRFIELGTPEKQISVAGNIKFDLSIPDSVITESLALRHLLGEKSFVWIAASTHPGEDEIILAAHKKLLNQDKTACLILVPRHPERFDAVFSLCNKEFTVKRRSNKTAIVETPQVFLGDTMGELLVMYAASDVAFVGGSLIPHGGHNFIEPAILQKAILSGQHVFNFSDVSQRLIANDALKFIHNAKGLFHALNELREDVNQRHKMGKQALIVANENRGSLKKQLAICTAIISTLSLEENKACSNNGFI